MNITNAFWEQRNMGVTSDEVIIENDDLTEEIRAALEVISSSYVVVKSPIARLDIYMLLQELGYSFAELLLRVEHDVSSVCFSSSLSKRLSEAVTFSRLDKIDSVLLNIKKGMFSTDRVSLDPFFTDSQASDRYVGWMCDELKRGSRFFEYLYKGEPIGFSCMRQDEEAYYPVLGGMYLSDKPIPLGSVLPYKQLELAKNLGGKMLYTYISSNNKSVVKAYSQCGYSITDMQYVFIKHNDIRR